MATTHKHTDCTHDPLMVAVVQFTPDQVAVAAAMCRAMSDAPRLQLLLWLAQREMCVSELVELARAKLGTVSARLQLLHGAHLVTRRRLEKHIYYQLADDHVRALLHNVLSHAAESQSQTIHL